jgi:hypothetical protein
MIDAVVDREDNWKKLEGIKNRKAEKNKSISDQFEECLEETEDLFNDYLIGKVSKVNEDNQNAEDGHFKDLNSLIALIEYGKRLNCQNPALKSRIRKLMDQYIFKDYGTFDRHEFSTKLREWEPHDIKTTLKKPTNAAAMAKENSEFQKKLLKAKEGKYCVRCERKDCLEYRFKESREKKIRLVKVECLKKTVKKTEEKPSNVDNSDEDDDEEETKTMAASVTASIVQIPKHDYFLMLFDTEENYSFSAYFPGDRGYNQHLPFSIDKDTDDEDEEEDDATKAEREIREAEELKAELEDQRQEKL